MQPLGTKVYLLKRYSPSDSFCTFFSESVSTKACNFTVCRPTGSPLFQKGTQCMFLLNCFQMLDCCVIMEMVMVIKWCFMEILVCTSNKAWRWRVAWMLFTIWCLSM